jgi:hypothetical protein
MAANRAERSLCAAMGVTEFRPSCTTDPEPCGACPPAGSRSPTPRDRERARNRSRSRRPKFHRPLNAR